MNSSIENRGFASCVCYGLIMNISFNNTFNFGCWSLQVEQRFGFWHAIFLFVY